MDTNMLMALMQLMNFNKGKNEGGGLSAASLLNILGGGNPQMKNLLSMLGKQPASASNLGNAYETGENNTASNENRGGFFNFDRNMFGENGRTENVNGENMQREGLNSGGPGFNNFNGSGMAGRNNIFGNGMAGGSRMFGKNNMFNGKSGMFARNDESSVNSQGLGTEQNGNINGYGNLSDEADNYSMPVKKSRKFYGNTLPPLPCKNAGKGSGISENGTAQKDNSEPFVQYNRPYY
jgi:hypothetical protein